MIDSYLASRDLISNSSHEERAFSTEVKELFHEQVSEGQRSDQFFRIVKAAHDDGWDQELISRMMTKWDEANGAKYQGRVVTEVSRCLRNLVKPPDLTASVRSELQRLRVKHLAKVRFEEELTEEVGRTDSCEAIDLSGGHAEVKWLVDSLLVRGGRCLVTGKRKAGKTTFCLNLAQAYLTGKPLLGTFSTSPSRRNVAVLNFDMPAQHLKSWFQDAVVPDDRLFIFDRRNQSLPFGPGTRLADNLKRADIGLLIVDNFGAAFDGADQNAAGPTSQWLSRLNRLTEAAGVDELVLLAHQGHQGERVRGSSALEDWADCIVRISEQEKTRNRFFSAFGRDVDVKEDLLTFDPETRQLTLSGLGTREQISRAMSIDYLAEEIMSVMSDKIERQTGKITEALSKKGVTFSKGNESTALRRLVEAKRLSLRKGARNSSHYQAIGTGSISNPVQTVPSDPFGVGKSAVEPEPD